MVTATLAVTTYAQDAKDISTPTKHNKNLTLEKIAQIQPGLGTIMMEFGHRFYIAYYAAKERNWELAKYEIHELIEAQEVAEVTRPKYTKKLKEFENRYIKPLNEAIEKKDWDSFSKLYSSTTSGCNNCHIATKHPYIKYKLPKIPPSFLEMK
jgi:hypothetical protein